MKTLHFTNSWHASSGGIRTFYRELLKAAEPHQRPMRMVVPSETTYVESINAYARIYHVAAPRSLLFDSRYRLLLYVGRLSAEKNLPLLLHTLRCLRREEHRDFRLLIAGDGPQANWLRQESLRLAPQRVHLLGQLNHQTALASLYANCDAFLHPNPREPFGIAPLEAMASGLPLIAPNTGGVLSYANSENAWLTEPVGEAFAEAVREVFSDDEVKWYRIARARCTAESYAWEKVTTEFFQLYDSLYKRALEETSTGRFSKAKRDKLNLALDPDA